MAEGSAKFETASSVPPTSSHSILTDYDPEANKSAVTNSKSVTRKKSTLYLEREGVTLEFDNIVLSTRSKNHEKHPPKQILKGVSSHFPASTLTAIIAIDSNHRH